MERKLLRIGGCLNLVYKIMNIDEINPLERPLFLNCIYAMETVYDAYSKGAINWNVYQKVKEKIESNMNGSWMYEQK